LGMNSRTFLQKIGENPVKYFIAFLFLTSLAYSQQKNEGRFHIYDLGAIDGFATKVLLDSQTGQCWGLVRDSTWDRTLPVWSPMTFKRPHEFLAVDTTDGSFYPTAPVKWREVLEKKK
jgi:hypothetical protein